jgi:hypothetical protein
MVKYKVKYHFSKDLTATRIIEAESKEDAMIAAKAEKVVRFEERGVLYEFNIEDVKMITVSEFAKVKAVESLY